MRFCGSDYEAFIDSLQDCENGAAGARDDLGREDVPIECRGTQGTSQRSPAFGGAVKKLGKMEQLSGGNRRNWLVQ